MSAILIQAMGFIAVIFFIISYQIRSNRALFLCQLIGCLIICIQMLLFGSPCTLLYDILVHTWGGALSEAITLASIIISIFRFGWKNLDQDESAAKAEAIMS